MKRKILIILFIFSVNSIDIYSQVHQDWTATYDYDNGDGGFRYITTDNDGNVIVSGGIGSNHGDYLTIKYNSDGAQQWVSTYNGTANDEDAVFSLTVDRSNNIYVTGWSKGVGTNYDYATVKYNSNGVQLWVARYNGIGNETDLANSIAVDSLQNVYVTGQSLIDNTIFGADIVTVKYNSSGVQQWVKKFSGTKYRSGDWGSAVMLDKSNNIYVTGSCVDSVTGQSFATIKYNTNGVQQWSAKYNGAINGSDQSDYIVVDSVGNVYVSGNSQGSMYYNDYATVKYNSLGIEQWSRRYDGSAHFTDQVRGMEIDGIENIYVTGYSTELGSGYDYTTIKYNSNGERIWLRRYNHGSNDIPSGIKIDIDDNIYITGQSDGDGSSDDFATVKFDSSGNQIWVIRYNHQSQSDDDARVLAIDNLGNVFVTGVTTNEVNNRNYSDYLTIKYSQTLTGVYANPFETPSEFKLLQNYPNPFNPNTIISFSILENVKSEMSTSQGGSNVKLIVYSSLGNEVATLVNERKNAGSYEVEFNGSNFSSGTYFYSLSVDGNLIDTKKMILLK